MESIDSKIKLIDEICKFHPSYGVSKWWSEYVGGMADRGEWFFRKMLDVDEKELQEFLYVLNHPPDVRKERELEDWLTELKLNEWMDQRDIVSGFDS